MGFDSREYIDNANARQEKAPVEYAGFWIRFVAYFLDGIILGIPLAIVMVIIIFGLMVTSSASSGSSTASPAGLGAINCLICLMDPVIIILIVAYFAWFESSQYQATPGKMILGLKVTDLDGNRITFGKALVRFILKMVINIFLYIGYIYIAFSDKKQGLYDVIAGTLVVKK